MTLTAEDIAELSQEAKAEIKRNPIEYGLFPLSHAQERLWFLDRLTPGTPNYNMPAALELRGTLDVAALQDSLNGVVERHEALRTCFLDVDGVPLQAVLPARRSTLEVVDLSGLPPEVLDAERARRMLQEAQRPFDLAAGHLFRWLLLRLGAEHHVLLATLHHIVSDDWSNGVLMREISALYRQRVQAGAALPELPIQYVDFACWQREQLQGERLQALYAHSRERLAGAPELLSLPLDRPRPAVQSFRGARIPFSLDAALVQRLSALAQARQATLFMVLLTGFKALMQRYSGQDDIVVATPIANRGSVELESLIGLFFNTLVLRTRLNGDPSFALALDRVRETALDAYEHQDMPFVKLVEAVRPGRALSHNPLVQVMFILQNAPQEQLDLPGLDVRIAEVDNRTAQFDLILALRHQGAALEGYVHFNTEIFEPATMERLASHFRNLLAAAEARPGVPLSALKMLGTQEWNRAVVSWNDTAHAYAPGLCLHTLAERQAAVAPGAVAVIHGRAVLRYGELDARANRLAHQLRLLGAGAGANVGLCLNPGPDMVVALLAVLKAGSAYVPMDPAYPAERLAFMLQDAGIAVLVTEAAVAATLPATALPVLMLDRDAQAIAAQPATAPTMSVGGEHLAYVIYTSGTTGRPKGVMVRHAGIVNNLLDLNRRYGVGPGDSVLALSSFSFDMCVYETFGLLAAGGTVIVPEREGLRDPAHWVRLLDEHRVTIWNSAPALLEMLVQLASAGTPVSWPALRLAILGGDWVAVSLPGRLQRLAPAVRVIVLGGATEASIHSIVYPVDECDPAWLSIPYGRPMDNQRAYVLDAGLQPVPLGVPGELYLGGDGLARGYYARPGLTAEKFLPDPHAPAAGARMYRTGDVAKYREDGTIILIGRADHQVKIRGHRIELAEIEAVLEEQPGIEQAVVAARPDATGDKQLVAYVVLRASAAPADWQAAVRAALPGYMVPARVVVLERLPLSPNGKVDRKALPAPDALPHAAAAVPMSPLQGLVADLFEEVLGIPVADPAADFFELGGHSLRATQLVSQVREVLGVELPLRTFMEAPDVASLARAIEALAQAQGIALEPVLAALSDLDALDDADIDRLLDTAATQH